MKDILLIEDSMLSMMVAEVIFKQYFKDIKIFNATSINQAERVLETQRNIGVIVSETYFNGKHEYDKVKKLADKYKTHKVGILTTQPEIPIDNKFIFVHEKPIDYGIIIKTIEKYI